jgi:hypothetical protein
MAALQARLKPLRGFKSTTQHKSQSKELQPDSGSMNSNRSAIEVDISASENVDVRAKWSVWTNSLEDSGRAFNAHLG